MPASSVVVEETVSADKPVLIFSAFDKCFPLHFFLPAYVRSPPGKNGFEWGGGSVCNLNGFKSSDKVSFVCVCVYIYIYIYIYIAADNFFSVCTHDV